MSEQKIAISLDVSKKFLDLYNSDTKKTTRLDNKPETINNLIAKLILKILF